MNLDTAAIEEATGLKGRNPPGPMWRGHVGAVAGKCDGLSRFEGGRAVVDFLDQRHGCSAAAGEGATCRPHRRRRRYISGRPRRRAPSST